MAIVFTSPEKNKRKLFWGITALLILSLFAASLIILLPEFKNQPQNIQEDIVFNTPAVGINFSIIDSEQVKNLEQFSKMETEFTYIAQDKTGKQVIGKISAETQDKAKRILARMGFKISELKESVIGRDNPFNPYYQSTTQTTTQTTTTKK